MKANQLKQTKQLKEQARRIEEASLMLTQQLLEEGLFNKHVPWLTRYLMQRSPRLRKIMAYEIGTVDGNLGKMILSRAYLWGRRKGGRKVIAKTY